MRAMADAPEPKEDRIGFAQLVEDALRGVVREALRKVGREGLPGEHHFYITCRTHYSGVKLPVYLKERFPEEITLVLQNQFWGLDVADDHFAVNLTFSGKSERLRVPFAAVTGFVDPSIDFGLQFKPTTPALAAAAVAPTPTPPPKADAKPAADKAKDGDGPKVVKLDTLRRG
ncbi:MAG: hypothetical protein EXQ93_02615 [Alphaproteobacteria bacterium]|nr:hypothetical protein [Alphaproteobacteria bacterium]